MFEKDAEKYRLNLVLQLREKTLQGYDCQLSKLRDLSDIEVAFQKGADCGYNKANEWHFVKDGDLPKGNGLFVIYWKLGDIDNYMIFRGTIGDLHKDTIAWKEITPPKESE